MNALRNTRRHTADDNKMKITCSLLVLETSMKKVGLHVQLRTLCHPSAKVTPHAMTLLNHDFPCLVESCTQLRDDHKIYKR